MRKKILTYAILCLVSVRAISNQAVLTKADSLQDCPRIKVYCVANSCCRKKRIFRVAYQGSPEDEPNFKWRVSSGEIINGQGDGEIEVDATKTKDPMEVTVDIGGKISIPEGCPTTAKFTTECQKNCQPNEK